MENSKQHLDLLFRDECVWCGLEYEDCECNDGVFYHEYDDDPEDEWIYDDVCCHDIRYRGPKGYCHCQEVAEQEERDSKWYNKIKHAFYCYWFKIKSTPRKIRRGLIGKRLCELEDLDDLPF